MAPSSSLPDVILAISTAAGFMEAIIVDSEDFMFEVPVGARRAFQELCACERYLRSLAPTEALASHVAAKVAAILLAQSDFYDEWGARSLLLRPVRLLPTSQTNVMSERLRTL